MTTEIGKQMDYKTEMRKLIDIVKQMGLKAPLEQTLDDLKVLSAATKDLSDRVEMRVRNGLQQSDKGKGKVVARKKTTPKTRTTQIEPSQPKPQAQQQSQSDGGLPTTNQPNTSAITQQDYNRAADKFIKQQRSLAPIRSQPPL